MKTITLLSLFCLMTTAAQTQQKDTRELPVQVVSAGTTLMGLNTIRHASFTSLGAVVRVPVGAAVAAGGIVGMLYTKTVLKQADAWHDIGCEVYYEDKVRWMGLQCPPAVATKYAFYAGKNKLQGNIVPLWIREIQKDLYKK